MNANITAQPTVCLTYFYDGRPGSAVAYADDGEILETVAFTASGLPDWSEACVCDHRGAGGMSGFRALARSLAWAEINARAISEEVRRVPVETVDDRR